MRSLLTCRPRRTACVQKGGGAMCALQGRRRTGAFALPEGDRVQGAGAPDPRAAGAPFTSMELETRAGGPLERD